MKHKKNNHGFTLVELLVAISILGIITIIALPQISNIQNNNQKTKYKKYAETMLTSGKLYVDAYTEDLFGNNTSGCVDIAYNDMRAKNLLKEIKVDGATCDTDLTFIRVRKSNNHYTYETSISCKDKNGNTVYENIVDRNDEECNTSNPDMTGPRIYFSNNGSLWANNPNQSIKVQIEDNYGMLENTTIKYIWMIGETPISDYTTYEFKNKRYEGKTGNPITTPPINIPTNASGEYFLRVIPIDVRDANGNYQFSPADSETFKIDNTPPSCEIDNEITNWTNQDRTITVSCSDAHSGCKSQPEPVTYSSGTIKTATIRIEDNVGNYQNCTFNVYLDKESPNAPTTGSIGNVSGSNETGNIKTPSSATTDVNNGSGFKEIRYIIKNQKETPSSSEFTSTSTAFTRSCGTSYYAYAAAVDNAGNISNAYYLGTTSDGKNEYGSYGECSAKCGGGTQTRTNKCALITDTSSTSCNTQDCCSSTTTNWGSWSSCSASCGGGTQSRTGTIVSAYDGSVCGGTDYDSRTCNTDSCEPTYEPNNCKIRGSTLRSVGSWQCQCGRTHTSAYIHYCTNSSGKLVTKGDNPSLNTFWYVCSISPYGPAQGWLVVDD